MATFGVGFDIGTTTVQAQLVDLASGEVLEAVSFLNDQRRFGADVMSRINAARGGNTGELFTAINRQAEDILRQFIRKWNLRGIEKCAVSGNTTMLHLFAGVDPSAMGEAPFTPVFLEERHLSGGELSLSADQVTLMPGISAFIGADVVCGLAFLDIINKRENFLFVDIGTNGEIAAWKSAAFQSAAARSDATCGAVSRAGRLLCCSTAAGPCFEGADISCDMTAAEFINAIAKMKRLGVISETGSLADEYAHNGFPVTEKDFITQRDVRMFQLAKSAVFSGIKVLCKTAGINLSGCPAYIAGNLGFFINLENAAEVGLLPKEFAAGADGRDTESAEKRKATVCGNTSLKGAVKSLTDAAFLPRCREIAALGTVIDLAVDGDFAEEFMQNMWV